MKILDTKGLLWFLGLTFCATYAVEFAMMGLGYSFAGVPPLWGQLTVAGVMFFPGIAAYIVRKFITREGFGDSGLKIGSFKYYVQSYLAIPLIFAAIYALTWIFVSPPDFSLKTFLVQYGVPSLPIPAWQMSLAIFLSSLSVAPFLNSIPAFGEEFGWRGYLLPKLLPLGKTRALILSGCIWGLWHAPLILIGYRYGNQPLVGILCFTVLLVFLGIFIGYFRLKSGSVILAAFIHGLFNAQAYGVWTLIFPTINPVLGGFAGITGLAVFGVISFFIMKNAR